MADLVVDWELMQAAAKELARASSTCTEVQHSKQTMFGQLDPAIGDPTLVKASDHFLWRWGYGCQLMAVDLNTLSTWLAAAAALYKQVETEAAAAAAENR